MKTNSFIFLWIVLLSIWSCSEVNEEEIIKNFYPLDFCIVTGNDLGDMGGPVSYDHNGTLTKFCCKPCIPKFQKNPAKYLVLLQEELEAQKTASLENNSS